MFPAADNDTHAAVYALEVADHDHAWDSWISRVEQILRDADRMPADLDITPERIAELELARRNGWGEWRVDGDQTVDGWSLDGLYDQFVAGVAPEQAIA